MIAATRPRVVSPGLVALPPQIAKKKKVPNIILYNIQKQIITPWSTAKSALVLYEKEGLELQV